MRDNNDIFNRIWTTASRYGLSFISSNGGTGKTTYFKFRLLRDALSRGIPFHIYTRYSNQMETLARSFIDIKPHYSKRKTKLLSLLDIEKEKDKFIYIIEKASGRRLAQILNVNGQAVYKQFGNMIHAQRALFDEVLAENGDYCPDEINKFNRLVFTMARSDDYKVFCLYNNTSPSFDYFTYYGGKSYNTHVSKSGALFLYFTAHQYEHTDAITDARSIQSIIQNTAYNDVYCHNAFVQYPTFYDPADMRGARTHFKLEIENQIFKVRELDGIIYLDSVRARKDNKKPIFTINDPTRTTLRQLPDATRYALSIMKGNARIKTNNMNNTIFCKILAERI